MNNKVSVSVNGEAILSRVSRMFDNTPESIMLELAQNARRAGATEIVFDVSEEDRIAISHDGKPFDDFNVLFSLGDSGWDDEGIKSEDPAGCGFFIATIFDSITVNSRAKEGGFYSITFGRDELLKQGSTRPVSHVTAVDMEEGVNVRLILEGKHNINYYNFDRVATHFPVPMRLKDADKESKLCVGYLCKIDDEENKRKHLVDRVVNNVRFIILEMSQAREYGVSFYRYNTDNILFNYHGHHTYSPSGLLANDVLFRNATGSDKMMLIVPQAGSDIRMVLPARNNIVKDDAFKRLCVDTKNVIIDYINSLSSHNMSYATYTQLGGAEAINKEAEIPDYIRDRSDSSIIIDSGIMSVETDYILSTCGDDDIVRFPKYDRYKGYSWCDALDVYNDDNNIAIMIDDKITTHDNTPDEGLVDSIKLVLIDADTEELIRVIHDNVHSAFITVYEEEFYGCMAPDMYAFHTADIQAMTVVGNIVDFALDNWNEQSDGDADSIDRQRQDFEEDIRSKLTRVLAPDSLAKEELSLFLENNSYEFSRYSEIILIGREGEKSFKITAKGTSMYNASIEEINKEKNEEV